MFQIGRKAIDVMNETSEPNVCGGFKHCVDRKYSHKFEDCEECKNDVENALAELNSKYEHLDIEEVWDVIWTAYIMGKSKGLLNELEIYRKWLPVLCEKLLNKGII